jgi:hypothetical protein
LGVNNGARIHNSKEILKSGRNTDGLLKLKVEGNNYADEVIVQIDPLAAISLDQMDAIKFRGSEDAPQLYSISADNKELSVNTFPDDDEYKVIPVGFEAGIAAMYTISVAKLSGFDLSEGDIYLEDLKENTFTKLSDSGDSYSFTGTPDDEPLRFLLHLNGSLGVHDVMTDHAQIKVFAYNQTVYISSAENMIGVVNIYDLLGQEIINTKLNGETMKKIQLSGSGGFMIVSVITEQGMVNQKVLIK